jgi:hypothetical protein
MACSAAQAQVSVQAGSFVFGTTVDNSANAYNDQHYTSTAGTSAAVVHGVTVASSNVELGNGAGLTQATSPYVSGFASLGVNSGGELNFLASVQAGVAYSFVLHADSVEAAQALADYMATVTPLSDWEPNPEYKVGYGGFALDGAFFAGISEDVPPFYDFTASASVNTGDFQGGQGGFSQTCDGKARTAETCGAYDALGNPILTPFSALGSLYFMPGGTDFYGAINLGVSINGQSQYYIYTAGQAIIDPAIHLAGGFGGEASHFSLVLPEGLGNSGALAPPPPGPTGGGGVPEPSVWAMMILGFGAAGAALRRRAARPAGPA